MTIAIHSYEVSIVILHLPATKSATQQRTKFRYQSVLTLRR